MLELSPDLVGLQEWYPRRFRLLMETGRAGRRSPPGSTAAAPRRRGAHAGVPLERTAVGRVRRRRPSRPLRAGAVPHPVAEPARSRRPVAGPTEPGAGTRRHGRGVPRTGTRVRTVSLVNYHLVSGVQSHGSYRTDRPLLVARHRREAEALRRLVQEQLALGHVVHAVGDSNFDGLRIDGLTSAWEGREERPGTLGPFAQGRRRPRSRAGRVGHDGRHRLRPPRGRRTPTRRAGPAGSR